MRPARLLVLRGGAIGDFIVTLPALRALRHRWPDAHLEVIGYPHVARLAEWFGLANRVRSLDEARIARYFAENAPVRDEDQIYFSSFDIVLNYLHDPDEILSGNIKRFGVEILINASPMVRNRHAVDHFLQPLESLAIYPGDLPASPLFPEERRPRAGQPWIALHPGSGGKRKCWPVERFVAIARRIAAETNLTPVFITGDTERELIPDLEAQLQGFERLHQVPLVELAERLSGAAAFVGNDAGITHLAAALGVPTLALFGPTDPTLWAPRGPFVELLAAPDGDLARLDTDSVLNALARLPLIQPRPPPCSS